MVTIVSNAVFHITVAERLDLKSSHHRKKKFC